MAINEVDEFDDGVTESQHATKTAKKLIGDAINVPIPRVGGLMHLKMEQIQEDLQSKHKVHFVDFIGVEHFNLILNYHSVDLVNLLKLTEKSYPRIFFMNLFQKTSKCLKYSKYHFIWLEDGRFLSRTRGQVLSNKRRLM